jgi:CCR4-NOT transcription complex subunit 4
MWCWHRIRESETGLCPACRTPYGDDPHQFTAVDVEEVLKANKEKEAAAKREKHNQQQTTKDDQTAPSIVDVSNALSIEAPRDRSSLANMRVIRRNLIYAVGMPPNVATEEILRRPEYFGQYGKIAKIVINRSSAGPLSTAEARRASASAYVTFVHKEDTLACILALDGFYLENRNIRASYGTSKYCSAFIKNVRCNNPECTYLHEMGAQEDTFTKQEIQAGYVTSGRDVLARQQQILAEQIRLAQAAAGGNGNLSLPRKRVGGGGPSGTGKAASNPMFPPPEYDEPTKATPVAQPPSVAASLTRAVSTSQVPQSTATNVTNVVGQKLVRAGTTGRVTSPSLSATASAASVAHRKSLTNASLTTAAAVVAGGRKESSELHQQHSTLTALTPLKRATVVKNAPTGNKATTAPRSASSSPDRSTATEEKKTAPVTTKNGKKNEKNKNIFTSHSLPLTEHFAESTSAIGGDVITQVTGKSILPPSDTQGLVGLEGPLHGMHGGSSGISSLGGVPIHYPETRHPSSSLSSSLGGEIFNGPLAGEYQQKSAIGSANDKWNASSIGGTPLSQLGGTHGPISSVGGPVLGNNTHLWNGNSLPSSNGVIGGQRLGGGGNSTSALASILGINLPTGSGSLHETSSLWPSTYQQSAGPSPISALNSSSFNTHPPLVKMSASGDTSSNSSSLGNSGSSYIGGVPIGGLPTGNYGAPGPIGGGTGKSDIALLQSLLPGVHVTSDSNNPLMGFGSTIRGWGVSSSLSQNGVNAGSGEIGGDPINTGNGWASNSIGLNNHHNSSIGAVGQHASTQNERQQGPGIW